MTLRQWCQREGHPLVTQVTRFAAAFGENVEADMLGRACVCGERHDPMPDGTGYRVLIPSAVDAEGDDRTSSPAIRSRSEVQGRGTRRTDPVEGEHEHDR